MRQSRASLLSKILFMFSFFPIQYLEMRFDRSLRLFGSIMFSVMNVCTLTSDDAERSWREPSSRPIENMIWIIARIFVAKMTTRTKRHCQFLSSFRFSSSFRFLLFSLSSHRRLCAQSGVQSSHRNKHSHHHVVCRCDLCLLHLHSEYSWAQGTLLHFHSLFVSLGRIEGCRMDGRGTILLDVWSFDTRGG